jgi:hypothetical protein
MSAYKQQHPGQQQQEQEQQQQDAAGDAAAAAGVGKAEQGLALKPEPDILGLKEEVKPELKQVSCCCCCFTHAVA